MILNESMFNNDKRYTNRVKLSYKDTNPLDYTDKLSKSDMENPSKVAKVISHGAGVINGSCSGYAGRVAKLMDYYGLSYKIYNGLAVTRNDRDYNDMIKIAEIAKNSNDKSCNHTWLVHNNKYYETFDNPEHLYIASEIRI